MSQFAKKWKSSDSESLGLKETIRTTIKGQEPLKPRLEQATHQIQSQVGKLETTIARMKEKDSSLFNKVVIALQKHDMQAASVLSNELAEVRKMAKMVSQSKAALEQINLRLSTVQELGDIAVTLSPAMGIIKSVRSGLAGFMPEAEHEIGEISGLLSSILVDAGQLGSLTVNFEAANEDAEKILTEASAVAEQRLKDKFPDLPVSSTSGAESDKLGQS
ncbi:MAG: Snf7 family protein [Nitrososphaeraceae archaeon]|nr:Snf7 family protein [Nitrososphaeraceae archaeon]